MNRFVVLASVVMLAAAGANCGGGSTSEQKSVLGPSSLSESTAAVSANGKGGGKPGGGGTTTGGSGLTLKMAVDNNGDGKPNAGDSVSFDVSTTATTEPHVSLSCSQNGTVVLSAVTGYYASYPWPWTQTMVLWSQAWTSGAADCTATLYYLAGTKTPTLATLRFAVAE